jgi:hypothetical protein
MLLPTVFVLLWAARHPWRNGTIAVVGILAMRLSIYGSGLRPIQLK